MSDSREAASTASAEDARAEHARERKKRGFDRFLLFTDAVVAIAITLLILPVVERASEIGGDDLTISLLLRESGPQIYGFLLSFAVIASMWMRHQEIFQNVETVNRMLVWANLGWLLAVIFLAFTTVLTVQHGNESIAAPIYIGNVALNSLMLTLSVTVLSHHPELLFPDTPPYVIHLRGSWIATGLLLLATVTALVVPAISYFALFLMFLQRPLVRLFVPEDERSYDWDA